MKNFKLPNISQFWNAKDYNEYATPQFEIAMSALSQWQFKGDEKILDIGCGNGSISSIIANKYSPKGFVTGIDLSNDMINFAKQNFKHTNLDFKAIDACDINFKEEFDLVFSFYCIHWIQDKQKLFKQISQALKTNCKAMIYLIANSIDNQSPLENLVNSVTSKPAWQKFFENYEGLWFLTNTDSFDQIIKDSNLQKISIEVIAQKIIFKNNQQAILWLKTLPLISPVPHHLQDQLLDEILHNYQKNIQINSDGSFLFILPTIKIVVQK